MRTLRNLAAGAAIAALALSTVAADDAGPTPPSVTATGTTAGGVTTVTGVATAETPGPESVEGLISNFDEPAVGSQLGISMTDALIEQIDNGVRFTWVVDNLHAPAPPEGVRYTWSFAIDGQSFQLQAKTTNLVGTTTLDDPAGHVTNAGASFQVRGNCETEWQGTPVSNCPHIGWATGSFDTDNNLVIMELEYGFHELFNQGSIISEYQTAAMSIAASGQAAVSNATTSSYINNWVRDYSAGLNVGLVAAPADANPDRLKIKDPLELGEDGSFTGSVEVADGLVAWVVACTGFTCTAQPVA